MPSALGHTYQANPLRHVTTITYVPLFQSTLDDIVSNQLNAKHDNGAKFRQHEH